MSKDAILRLQKTSLFKKLREIEKKEMKETSLEDNEVSQNIISVVCKAAPLLERVSENMPEFTLHNANHSIHVIENIERIVPYETLEQLNAIEISILIYAAYLHDIGMTSSPDEQKQIIETDSEFKKLLTSKEELYQKLEVAKNQGDNQTASNIENKIFTDFLRRNHVQRAHKIIKEYEFDSKISWRGISYCKWVTAVCNSHGLPVKDLYNTKSCPNDTFVIDKPVNVQYLAIIFRLADKLDIDPERTPKHLFYYINPKDEVSIKEWKKHLSITGFQITPEKVKIVADCKHPEQERTLREFIKTIDKELEDSDRLISSYRDKLGKKYILKLAEPVDADIHSNGYEYSNFRFELDYRRVLDLLMGEGLYGDPVVALRELLQNSVDAVRYRESLEKREGNGYTPCIEVSLKNNELTIEDNGIGMDEKIFENYFMKVGRSYYQSVEFRQKNLDVDPVSEFGIGILSVFMIADKFTVESRRKTFENEMAPSEPIYFEIPTAYDYFIKKISKHTKPGTRITLYLKPNHPFSAETLMTKISELAPFIEYKIVIHTINGEDVYEPLPLLPSQKMKKLESIGEYFEVLFDNKKDGIEGKLRIVNNTNKYIISNSLKYKIFAQKGFAIPCRNLLPKWLYDNIQASINLSNQSKLSLSPSRSYVVKDDKYTKLIGKIQSNILEGLEKYLETSKDSSSFEQYIKKVNELLENEILSLSQGFLSQGFICEKEKFENTMEKIFFNYVPLLIISDDGKRKYKTMKDLDTITSLAIIGANNLPEEIPDAKILEEIERLIGAKTILLMQEEVGLEQRSNFLKKILGNPSDFYITSIPGVVIETFHNNKPSGNVFFASYNKFIPQIHNDSIEKTPLFVNPPGINEADDTEIVYNAYHPLFARLLNGEKPKDEASSEAISILTNHLKRCLSHLYSTAYASSFRQNNGLQKNTNINYMLIGILKYYPEIFHEFYEAVKLYWEEAKDLGVISREEDFIGFSLDDLPWFWNYELTSFER